MPKFIHIHGWYNVIKELIIPLLGIFTTITIGIIIAVLLKRKEERAKIKLMLIDSYIIYLEKRVNSFTHEFQSFTLQILEDILSNYDHYFDSAKSHSTKELIGKKIEAIKLNNNDLKQNDTNWSQFTYRFCFLLSKKVYNKEAQRLENDIVNNYLSDKPRREFFSRIKTIIASDVELVKKMNSLQSAQIDSALDKIQRLIGDSYNEFQIRIFQPYDNKIADLIEAY